MATAATQGTNYMYVHAGLAENAKLFIACMATAATQGTNYMYVHAGLAENAKWHSLPMTF